VAGWQCGLIVAVAGGSGSGLWQCGTNYMTVAGSSGSGLWQCGSDNDSGCG
jgi:hypothetical protein